MVKLGRGFTNMIIDQDIDIQINGHNIHIYKDKHPHLDKGDTITINVHELSPRATLEVECICSNGSCGNMYLRKRRNIHSNNTYCTDKCRGEHIKTRNLKSRKRDILNRVKLRIDSGKGISYREIKEDAPTLLNAVDRYYPLWEICKDLEISEDELVNKYGLTRNVNSRTLSKKEIVERLHHLKTNGRLTTSAMRTEFEDFRLETSIKKVYGSVEQCLEKLGFERDIYSNNILIMMGRKFEQVFNDILNELEVKFRYNKRLSNGLAPDFYLYNEKTIIDTKLSSWTTSIESDIHNYSDHCDKLIFVYLREGNTLPKLKDKVELISVYDFISELPVNRQNYYKTELKNILSYHP